MKCVWLGLMKWCCFDASVWRSYAEAYGKSDHSRMVKGKVLGIGKRVRGQRKRCDKDVVRT